MLKLWHMPKSPDPSSTFPRVQMPSQFFIVHLHPTPMSPASTPGKFFFLICIVFFSLAETLFQVSVTRPPHAPSVLPQHLLHCPCPSVSFFFCCLAFADSCFQASLAPALSLCTSPPFVDTTPACPRLNFCKSFFSFLLSYLCLPALFHSLMPRPSVVPHPHSLVLHPFLVPLSCRVTPSCCVPSLCRVPVSCRVTPSCHVPVSYHLPTPSYRAPTLTRCTLHQPPTPQRILAA